MWSFVTETRDGEVDVFVTVNGSKARNPRGEEFGRVTFVGPGDSADEIKVRYINVLMNLMPYIF